MSVDARSVPALAGYDGRIGGSQSLSKSKNFDIHAFSSSDGS